MIDQPLSGIVLRERYLGGMMGLAVGDALGAQSAAEKSQERWMWTDLTGMALCLAESLVEHRLFHPRDQLERFVRWKDNEAGGLGRTVEDALLRYGRTGDMYCGSLKSRNEDAAAVARLVSVPLYYLRYPEEAIIRSGDSAMTTHGMVASIDACRYLAALVVGAAHGADKEKLLSDILEPREGFWERRRLISEMERIASGGYRELAEGDPAEPDAVKAVSIALRALENTDTFAEGAALAVTEGRDCDMPREAGAVYGQLAGVYYGLCGPAGIPAEWLERLCRRELIEETAARLHDASLRSVS
jgi:ADP-ribosyl-[dinitrogen reductase] hydrolase